MCFLCHEVQPGGQLHFVSHDHGYAHASCLATAYFAAQATLTDLRRRTEQAPMSDDLAELRSMARSPQHYSNYTLAGALHQVLDRLEDAESQVAFLTELRASLAAAAAQIAQLEDAIPALPGQGYKRLIVGPGPATEYCYACGCQKSGWANVPNEIQWRCPDTLCICHTAERTP